MSTQGQWLYRTVRGFRPDRNPLRRRMDRLETYLLAGLFLASAVGAPFAAQAASQAAYAGALHAQQAEFAARHQVSAKLTAPAGPSVSGYALQADVPAKASWTSVTGVPGSGEVLAPPGSPKGTKVTVWTDNAGNLVSPPLADSQVSGQRDMAAVAAVAGVGVLFLAEATLVRHVIYRRRMAAWDADWLVTERMWHRHQS